MPTVWFKVMAWRRGKARVSSAIFWRPTPKSCSPRGNWIVASHWRGLPHRPKSCLSVSSPFNWDEHDEDRPPWAVLTHPRPVSDPEQLRLRRRKLLVAQNPGCVQLAQLFQLLSGDVGC